MMLLIGTILSILVLANSAPAGVLVGAPVPAPQTNHVSVKANDDHIDSLEDFNDPHEVLEDHLDHVEDVLEDHYNVDLGDLFDVDDNDHYRLRTTYVVRPAVQTVHAVPGPTIVRKYFARPVVYAAIPTRPIIHVPLVSKPLVPTPVGPGVLTGTGGVGAASGTAAEPQLPPEVVRRIAEEEVKDAVEDIAKNPGIDVQKKAVEVIKEIAEETAEAKKEMLEDAAEAKKGAAESSAEVPKSPSEAHEDAVEAHQDAVEDAVEARKDAVEDAAEAKKDALEGDTDDDDNARNPRTI